MTVAMSRRPSRSRGLAARAAAAVILIATLAATGCMTPPVHDGARTGPFHTPRNVAAEAQLPAHLRRVIVLPIAGGTVATAESSTALAPVVAAELQKQNRFEIVVLTREDCLHRFRAEEFVSTGALPHDLMTRLRRDYAADAVMFIDLTAYKPYRPMVLGLRAKLATLGDEVRLVWTFDNVFSAGDEAVANAARRHYLASDRGGVPADLTPAVLQSPSRFAGYAAATMFATLPPVYTPPPAAPEGADAVNAR